MAVLLALISGIGSLLNLYLLDGQLLLQGLLTLLAWVALFTFRGKKSRSSYEHDGTRIFTFRFALILLAVLGSSLILLAKFSGWN
ncbi:hypothetical protein ACWOAN_03745 [Lactococcus taiwanensis]|jgi:hypothetical protein|uniref:hypothetical protein n=1 Tax=Lactococcus taiwanensis TaxID=1151742 RepID=UPI0007B29349|nr:hypothetical protein [Lactococcus taiwanensis]KZK37645.1 hypothetical protein P7266_1046 [Lactococcus cremoris]